MVFTQRRKDRNSHQHVLVLYWVYVIGDEALVFGTAPLLSDQDVQQTVETSARRILDS